MNISNEDKVCSGRDSNETSTKHNSD